MTAPITPEHVAALLADAIRGHWLVIDEDECADVCVMCDREPSPVLVAASVARTDAALIAAAPGIARAYIELAGTASGVADEVLRMVHAFGDAGRKDAVRDLAQRVAAIERERDALRAEVERLRAVETAAVELLARLPWKPEDGTDRLAAIEALADAIVPEEKP
jgi:hypothetical protein